jgi:hypothetical protein
LALVRVAAPQPVTVRPGISTVVALALFALFFVYITARGRLPQYLAVLFGPVSVSGAGTAASPVSGSGILGGLSQIATGGLSGATGSATSLVNPADFPGADISNIGPGTLDIAGGGFGATGTGGL